MDILEKPAFAVIGMEGSTEEGEGFISRLWQAANSRYAKIAPIIRTQDGKPAGLWGAMSDFGRRMLPWEEGFTRGLYLAGAEADIDAFVPDGWQKWCIPARKWLASPVSGSVTEAFRTGLEELERRGFSMVGAACDYTDPETGRAYVAFPIENL